MPETSRYIERHKAQLEKQLALVKRIEGWGILPATCDNRQDYHKQFKKAVAFLLDAEKAHEEPDMFADFFKSGD